MVDVAQIRQIRSAGTESDSPSRELARYIAAIATAYRTDARPLLVFRPDRYLRGGDQSSFNEAGYAAVRFTEYREDYSHQHQNVRQEGGVEYGDLLKFVDFEYVARVAILNAASLASLASAPAPPQPRLLTAVLENSSTLTWPSVERADKYEVLWRLTESPDWEGAKVVRGTSITLDMSKDNVVFGVRAIDAAGHPSPAVVPTAAR